MDWNDHLNKKDGKSGTSGRTDFGSKSQAKEQQNK